MIPTIEKNSVYKSNTPSVFKELKNYSAVVWQHELSIFEKEEISQLINQPNFIKIDVKGDTESVLKYLQQHFNFPNLKEHVELLIHSFVSQIENDKLRLMLSIVDTDMCRKFHTDIIDYRLVCTYFGEGTLFVLPENEKLMETSDECIEQLEVGEAMLFKGALSSSKENPALLHKSPIISTKKESKRLFLRLDTLNFGLEI
ncbi:Protein of unknown function (DUF1826) [Bernardetia litoralis DSM 6794]|uniref:DUF1826 domain-containing protein n=1 Tax=Bernardetia litoralis (strain ATCC 23117 / DSM 6794 / NBRC 15988 / NCIMB 1366 / Fx l1 / Sio-4) TaxID=880071 RepID=I4AIL7_BERLS|nr:DUF1826 domain-containing protein [Bernardetia litoralis]AFM03802.1 Protein of unknown function (DUF1826) [Bernardetia litoralis DSM 6794]